MAVLANRPLLSDSKKDAFDRTSRKRPFHVLIDQLARLNRLFNKRLHECLAHDPDVNINDPSFAADHIRSRDGENAVRFVKLALWIGQDRVRNVVVDHKRLGLCHCIKRGQVHADKLDLLSVLL